MILAFVTGLERLGGPIRELIAEYSQITKAQMRYRMLLDAFPEHQKLKAAPELIHTTASRQFRSQKSTLSFNNDDNSLLTLPIH